jgi:hypothetical protein
MENGWLPNHDGNFYKPGLLGQSFIDNEDSTVEGFSRELD